jgi:ribosomal protein S18
VLSRLLALEVNLKNDIHKSVLILLVLIATPSKMLRRLVQKSSMQLLLHDVAIGQPLNSGTALLLRVPSSSMQLTCLRNFSAANDDTSNTTGAKVPVEKSQTSTSSSEGVSAQALQPPPLPSSSATTSTAMLQNAKLWRQWVDGRIDERHRMPTSQSSGNTNTGEQHQRNQQNQRQQNHHRPRDHSKDWKSTSRSLRSTQDRIASILVPEGDQQTPHYNNGKYGVLGTASDAPKVVPGAAARAEEVSPDRLLPHRLFYPGATYSPDELDPYKAKPVGMLSDLTIRRGTISRSLVATQADFRNPSFLNNFISDAGKLSPKRRTRLPAKMHRELARQVKLARSLALMNPTNKVMPARQMRSPMIKQRSAGIN